MKTWISVDNALPDHCTCVVFLLRNGTPYTGYLGISTDGKEVFIREVQNEIEEEIDMAEDDEAVTHWMYLPELPNVGATQSRKRN
jgi:hypothetical protein